MNAEVDEGAEERKGGAGHLGKMLLSAGNTAVRVRVCVWWVGGLVSWCGW